MADVKDKELKGGSVLDPMEYQAILESVDSELRDALPQLTELASMLLGEPPHPISDEERLAFAAEITAKVFDAGRFAEEVAEIAEEPDQLIQWSRTLALVDAYFRSLDSELPADEHAMGYYSRTTAQLAAPPRGWPNRAPWRYRLRHAAYRSFLGRVIQLRGYNAVQDYLMASLSPGGLMPQFQSVSTGGLLTDCLRRKPPRVTTQAVRSQIEAWSTLAGNWDRLTRVPYGLICICGGKSKSWEETGAVSLRNRSEDMRAHGLGDLARPEWVTIKNSFSHGGCIHNPAQGRVEFHDRRRTVCLNETQLHVHAIDMALSCRLMFMTGLLAADIAIDAARPWIDYFDAELRQPDSPVTVDGNAPPGCSD